MRYDVLVVDDESELAEASVEYLQAFGISAIASGSAEAALDRLDRDDVQLILLDVNLPGVSGFELCRRLRSDPSSRRSRIPIIFISARGGEDDQILALSIGGDDYLTKPFSLALLLAKVRRALARTTGDHRDQGYQDDWLRVDVESGRTYVDGREITLKAMEDRLLRFLISRRGQVVTKQELFEGVWGEAITGDGTLTVHVRRLRAKIERDPDHPSYIKTVWGRGYLFEGR